MKLIRVETGETVAIVVENPKTKEFELEVVDTTNYELKDGEIYEKGTGTRVAFIFDEEITYVPGVYDFIFED